MSAVEPRRLFVALGLFYCCAKLVLLLTFSLHTRFVMDEYNLASYSLMIPDGFYEVVDPVKTVLQVYFYDLARGFASSAVDLVLLQRVEGVILAFGMVLLVYLVSRNLGGSRLEALFSVSVLLTFSTFMERSFRIRSESVAVFLPLLALWVVTRSKRESWKIPLLTGMLIGSSFLATQKSIYYGLAFGVAYLAVKLREGERRHALSSALIFSSGWVISLLGYALFFGGLQFHRVILMIFTSPLEVALHADELYADLGAFVTQTLTRNQLAYGLCFTGIGLALFHFRRLSAEQAFVGTVTAVISTLVFLHNQPWPYVFVMAIPYLAVWSPYPLRALGLEGRRQAAAFLVLLATLALSLIRNVQYLEHSNADQRRVMAQAEALLSPGDRYGDGVGMIPTRRWAGNRWIWDAKTIRDLRAAAESQDYTELEAIFADQPKLWIYNYRVDALWPLLSPYIERSYVPVSSNVLLTGCELPPDETVEFPARWAGSYGLYDRNGRALEAPFEVDGTRVRGEVTLAVGTHRLRLPPTPAAESAFLLPVGLSLSPPLPHSGPPIRLFGSVYQ